MGNANALAVYDRVADPVALATNDKMVVAVAAFVGCSVQQAPAIMLTCQLQGIDLMEYMRNYHPIAGRPTKQTQAAVADFLTLHGGKQRIVEFGPDKSVIVFTDRDGNETTWSLTLAEAHEAGWCYKSDGKTYKDNWRSSVKRADMLYYRNASRALKKLCPSIFAGLLSSEEAADLAAEESVAEKPANRRKPRASEAVAAVSEATAAPVVEAVVESPAANATPEPTDDGIVGAEFVVSTPDQVAGSVPAAVDAPPSCDSAAVYATRAQLDRIVELRSTINLSDVAFEAALAKRNVRAAASLTIDQAQEIIDKMAVKAAELATAKN